MIPWVMGLIWAVAGPIRDLARQVAHRISVVWSTLTRVFSGIRRAWGSLYAHIRDAVYWLRHALTELYYTAKWLVLVYLPRRLRALSAQILTWAKAQIHLARAFAQHLVTLLGQAVTRLINAVRNTLTSFVHWVQARLADLRTFLDWFKREVLPRLTSPGRFAEWVIAAIVSALWRYAFKQRDRIAGWFLRTSPAFALWLARTVDDVLGRLL